MSGIGDFRYLTLVVSESICLESIYPLLWSYPRCGEASWFSFRLLNAQRLGV